MKKFLLMALLIMSSMFRGHGPLTTPHHMSTHSYQFSFLKMLLTYQANGVKKKKSTRE